jgi:ABC-type amino acid transport system permease subunit
VRGADAEFNINDIVGAIKTANRDTSSGFESSKLKVILGGSYVSKYEQGGILEVDSLLLAFPQNVGLMSGRANVYYGPFSIYLEYAHKVNDPSKDNGYIYNKGEAFFANASFSKKGFGINALTGVLTIGLHSVGMIGKLFSESIDNMDRGPIEAIQSFGGSKVDQARYGIIPQVLPEFISIALYRFDINVRSATVLGIIGAGGIGTSLILASENWNWDILGTILLAIVIMVLSIDFISNFLRKKLI